MLSWLHGSRLLGSAAHFFGGRQYFFRKTNTVDMSGSVFFESVSTSLAASSRIHLHLHCDAHLALVNRFLFGCEFKVVHIVDHASYVVLAVLS